MQKNKKKKRERYIKKERERERKREREREEKRERGHEREREEEEEEEEDVLALDDQLLGKEEKMKWDLCCHRHSGILGEGAITTKECMGATF
jgi:parvulin-like peptidyl-prolyl isomerase